MPGPPRSRNPRRGNKQPEWRTLPRAGRDGRPPDFPLPGFTDELLGVWAEFWSSPQADAWESLGWTRVVARYAKLLVVAEGDDAPVTLLGEVRQLEDRLGLTPMAMKRLAWEIDDCQEADEEHDADVANLADYRDRLG